MATKEEMSAQLDALEADDGVWSPAAKPERKGNIHPAVAEALEIQRRREEANERAIVERLRRESAQRRQYAETHAQFLAGIVDHDPEVAPAVAAVEAAQRAVEELTAELLTTRQQLQALNQNAVVDLSSVSMKELLKTAGARARQATVEASALLAVRDELGRRLADAEASLAEAQHTLLRRQRVALHRHCDLLIEQLKPLLFGANDLFSELYKCQVAITEMGGPRQALLSGRWKEQLSWAVERWDREILEIRRFSEQY